ncbi:hypothetical protein [Sulfitobacter sp. PS-8MA]|uniref:hypothetical protein n=1 Tax=Sulfitobacter sp. PS-8MA TaxID=3237707 RepID=UPI0034C69D10
MLALLAGPALAAPAAQEEAGDTAKDAPAAPALPASMQSHGVIGHVPPLTGLPLLDPEILARMRERLIVLSQEPDK